ncbi:hypothetical protein C0J52_24239 [Blattella germanica]|nr:hypothetical protein C0J52_24239 [Blattella germanica]
MSVRAKTRESANPIEQATLTVNEKILRECHTLYTDPDKGLIKIAEQFNLKLLAPRKKIVVLLIGNHSAGKSSFINCERTLVAKSERKLGGKGRHDFTKNGFLHPKRVIWIQLYLPGETEDTGYFIEPTISQLHHINTFRTEPVRDTGSGTWPAERSPYVIRAREHGRLNGARMPYVAIYLMLLNGVCRMHYVPRVFQHGF